MQMACTNASHFSIALPHFREVAMKVIDFLHLSQGGDVVDQSLGDCPIAGLGIHPRSAAAVALKLESQPRGRLILELR